MSSSTGCDPTRVRARIELLGYLSRLSELLADSEALVFLDDPLELRTAVARLEREAAREVSNGLVLRDRELERLDAIRVGALAEKLRVRCILGNLLDAR